jgi:SPP1 gp7 family putative phage head morphogenesis protein
MKKPRPVGGKADRFDIPFGARRKRVEAVAPAKAPKTLRPVVPNAGIRAQYSRRLCKFIDQMARSYERWVVACYRANKPRMAMDSILRVFSPEVVNWPPGSRMSVDPEDGLGWLAYDASPAAELQRELRQLGARWQSDMDAGAEELARWFAKKASRRSDLALRAILRKAGMTVRFTMTRKMQDVFAATVAENVSLIKSIPQQYHTQVEGLVMRSVATGRDLHQLTRDLQRQFGVTERRAKFIALDQNNKATSALMKVRHVELGLDEGIWLHSHAGKVPRPTHFANHGKRFSIAEGWFDPDPRVRRRIMPGELPRCRCTWRPIVKGFS